MYFLHFSLSLFPSPLIRFTFTHPSTLFIPPIIPPFQNHSLPTHSLPTHTPTPHPPSPHPPTPDPPPFSPNTSHPSYFFPCFPICSEMGSNSLHDIPIIRNFVSFKREHKHSGTRQLHTFYPLI